MGDERNQLGSSGTQLIQDTTQAQGGEQEQQEQLDAVKAKKEGIKLSKKSVDRKEESEAKGSISKGKKPASGKLTRTQSKERDAGGERSLKSFASVAAAAKAGRQLQVQMLKSKASRSKEEEEDESKGREKKLPAPAVGIADTDLGSLATKGKKDESKMKKPPDKEEPAFNIVSDGQLGSHITAEHSTLIKLIRQRKERKEKEERKDLKEEDLRFKDGKQGDVDGKEKELVSPAISGNAKGKDVKPEETHLLHVGTPFEVKLKNYFKIFQLIVS